MAASASSSSLSGNSRVLVLGLLALAVALGLVGVFVVRWAEREFGSLGALVAVGAGAICYAGTAAALLLSQPTGSNSRDSQRLLGSILARTGIPLVACVTLAAWSRLPLQAVFGMVLTYYLVALSMETWLAVQMIRRGRSD